MEESGAQFTANQHGHLYDLRRLSFDATEEQIDKIILAFSISLIMHSDYDESVSVMKYFSGVMGYNLSQARWKQPGEYMTFLAPRVGNRLGKPDLPTRGRPEADPISPPPGWDRS